MRHHDKYYASWRPIANLLLPLACTLVVSVAFQPTAQKLGGPMRRRVAQCFTLCGMVGTWRNVRFGSKAAVLSTCSILPCPAPVIETAATQPVPKHCRHSPQCCRCYRPDSTRQYARLVASWVENIDLDPAAYGTDSMRRTKPTLIYRRTKNLRAVQILLGHTNLESTVRYLGIEVEDALEMAQQTDV